MVTFLLLVTVIPFAALAIDSVMLIPGEYSLSNFSLHYWTGDIDQTIGPGTGEPGVLRNGAILGALGDSVKLAVTVAVICGVAGMLIGYTVVWTRGTRLFRMIDQPAFLSYLMPSIAFGSIFLALFAVPRGPIPSLYGSFWLLVIKDLVLFRVALAVRFGHA